MKMSVSTFYYQKKPKSDESHIVQVIEDIIEDLPGSGYRTVTTELRKKNISLNHKKVSRLMRENNLMCKKTIKFKAQTTDSNHRLHKYPNMIKGKKETGLNQIIVGDVTQYFCKWEKLFFGNVDG